MKVHLNSNHQKINRFSNSNLLKMFIICRHLRHIFPFISSRENFFSNFFWVTYFTKIMKVNNDKIRSFQDIFLLNTSNSLRNNDINIDLWFSSGIFLTLALFSLIDNVTIDRTIIELNPFTPEVWKFVHKMIDGKCNIR